MSSNFGKIRRKNGTFLADDICLNRVETIKVASEDGAKNGLEFIVPRSDAWINDQWKEVGKSKTGHFHVISLQNGLRFPLPRFVLELLNDYGVGPSQLASNAWRIVGAFYLGCRILGIMLTSRLFHNFYFLKTREEFYFF